ncbi:MAG: DNA polymerase III subunit, partial [Desulfobacterales bacterium]
GKREVAIALALACNCLKKNSGYTPEIKKTRVIIGQRIHDPYSSVGPCGICKSCRKIESGNHPDIIQVKPTGAFIKIAQIRALCDTLAMKPYEASTRVVIIHDAQSMNPAASNALLKILEEPPERTILILIATQTLDLLPTVVSRCQHIRFNPISKKKLENLLVEQHGLDSDEALAIATMANGSLSRAITMYQANWVKQRNWVLEEINGLSSRPMGRILAFAERLSRDKDTILETLEVMKSWFRDLVMAKFYPEKIINQDIASDIQLASQKRSVPSLLSKIDLVQATQNSFHANTNLRLTLEVMLMKLAKS